jgi:hypothetical protein
MTEAKVMEDEKEQTMQNTETIMTLSGVSETVANLKGIPTKEQLMEMLRKEVVEVTFLKLDGDERKMPCTLKPSLLPAVAKEDPLTQKKVREISDKVIAVWAPGSNGFRSFRYDRVTKVEVLHNMCIPETERQL